jgi:hypothetical protein
MIYMGRDRKQSASRGACLPSSAPPLLQEGLDPRSQLNSSVDPKPEELKMHKGRQQKGYTYHIKTIKQNHKQATIHDFLEEFFHR